MVVTGIFLYWFEIVFYNLKSEHCLLLSLEKGMSSLSITQRRKLWTVFKTYCLTLGNPQVFFTNMKTTCGNMNTVIPPKGIMYTPMRIMTK